MPFMAPEHIFFDTNILFYAIDTNAGPKHETAGDLVRSAWEGHLFPVISVQVLQELFVNIEKKLMSVDAARSVVMDYLAWQVVENSRQIFISAITVMENFQISFWDASIIAAAQAAGATKLFSEHLNHGQFFGQLELVNPLNVI